MVDRCGTPFWGKYTPQRHYMFQGLIKFSVFNKELYYEIKYETLTNSYSMEKGKVKDKEHLDLLLTSESINEFFPYLV